LAAASTAAWMDTRGGADRARSAACAGARVNRVAAASRTGRPLLILTASMGAGHDQVARELAGRLSDRLPVRVIDLLELLPLRIGIALRTGYAGMIRDLPWLYEAIFQAFFIPRDHWQPSTSPLVLLAARRVSRAVARIRPCAVVSTFHLAGQAVGTLRQQRRLSVPSIVVVTEPAAHVLWGHPGTDMFVCGYPWVADALRDLVGRPVAVPGPVVDARFAAAGNGADAANSRLAALGRRRLGLGAGEHAVLLSTGSWGVGHVGRAVRALSGSASVRPVVLCGRNERLRQRLTAAGGCLALGWRDDLPALFAAGSALVDNAGGSTCAEAFAAGLPVIGHQPLAGHGRLGLRELIRAGVVADGRTGLRGVVESFCGSATARAAQCRRAAQVFRADPADVVAEWLASVGVILPEPATASARRGPDGPPAEPP
jgi:UDP-N-acetylglucosamine:LPS N-acetylglucosamine transferase